MEDAAAIEVLAFEAARLAVPTTCDAPEAVLELAAAWEHLGRVVDAGRAFVAAEVARCAAPEFGPDNLSARRGLNGAVEVLADAARISAPEARRRLAAGVGVAPREGTDGGQHPARYPVAAAHLRAGAIATESAAIIAAVLDRVRVASDPAALAEAEEALVETAGQERPELVRIDAEAWAIELRPDLVEPAEQQRRASRSAQLGRARLDGMTLLRVLLPPEESAIVRAVLTTHRKRAVFEPAQTAPEPTGTEHRLPGRAMEWREVGSEGRTRSQFDFDTLLGVVTAGLRAETTESSLTSPFEVLVHVDERDRARGEGAAWVDDVPVPLAMTTVERIACTSGSRLVRTGSTSQRLDLGRPEPRFFSPLQKKALAARDGGCAWPGCRAPVVWTHAHHIRWWKRDSGPTDVDNGVLLCSFHHHLIHTTDRWTIEMVAHVPHLVPADVHGPPRPEHRMQQHRLRQPRARSTPPEPGHVPRRQ